MNQAKLVLNLLELTAQLITAYQSVLDSFLNKLLLSLLLLNLKSRLVDVELGKRACKVASWVSVKHIYYCFTVQLRL